ncbi:hypothetical protein HDV00_009248 [Rhizophlyctis rosea]|nr:hypothetical protein HDV00_009248 [Rhizophlyctis rosea]
MNPSLTILTLHPPESNNFNNAAKLERSSTGDSGVDIMDTSPDILSQDNSTLITLPSIQPNAETSEKVTLTPRLSRTSIASLEKLPPLASTDGTTSDTTMPSQSQSVGVDDATETAPTSQVRITSPQAHFPLLLSTLPLSPRPSTRKSSLKGKPSTAAISSTPSIPITRDGTRMDNPDVFVSVVGVGTGPAAGRKDNADDGVKKEDEEKAEDRESGGEEIWKVAKLREGHAGYIRIRVKTDDMEMEGRRKGDEAPQNENNGQQRKEEVAHKVVTQVTGTETLDGTKADQSKPVNDTDNPQSVTLTPNLRTSPNPQSQPSDISAPFLSIGTPAPTRPHQHPRRAPLHPTSPLTRQPAQRSHHPSTPPSPFVIRGHNKDNVEGQKLAALLEEKARRGECFVTSGDVGFVWRGLDVEDWVKHVLGEEAAAAAAGGDGHGNGTDMGMSLLHNGILGIETESTIPDTNPPKKRLKQLTKPPVPARPPPAARPHPADADKTSTEENKPSSGMTRALQSVFEGVEDVLLGDVEGWGERADVFETFHSARAIRRREEVGGSKEEGAGSGGGGANGSSGNGEAEEVSGSGGRADGKRVARVTSAGGGRGHHPYARHGYVTSEGKGKKDNRKHPGGGNKGNTSSHPHQQHHHRPPPPQPPPPTRAGPLPQSYKEGYLPDVNLPLKIDFVKPKLDRFGQEMDDDGLPYYSSDEEDEYIGGMRGQEEVGKVVHADPYGVAIKGVTMLGIGMEDGEEGDDGKDGESGGAGDKRVKERDKNTEKPSNTDDDTTSKHHEPPTEDPVDPATQEWRQQRLIATMTMKELKKIFPPLVKPNPKKQSLDRRYASVVSRKTEGDGGGYAVRMSKAGRLTYHHPLLTKYGDLVSKPDQRKRLQSLQSRRPPAHLLSPPTNPDPTLATTSPFTRFPDLFSVASTHLNANYQNPQIYPITDISIPPPAETHPSPPATTNTPTSPHQTVTLPTLVRYGASMLEGQSSHPADTTANTQRHQTQKPTLLLPSRNDGVALSLSTSLSLMRRPEASKRGGTLGVEGQNMLMDRVGYWVESFIN